MGSTKKKGRTRTIVEEAVPVTDSDIGRNQATSGIYCRLVSEEVSRMPKQRISIGRTHGMQVDQQQMRQCKSAESQARARQGPQQSVSSQQMQNSAAEASQSAQSGGRAGDSTAENGSDRGYASLHRVSGI